MNQLSHNLHSYQAQDAIDFIPLVVPDDLGTWALRYVSIRHRFDNQEFIDNYFNGGPGQNINIRKMTSNGSLNWQQHNAMLDNSADSGDLIWRFKVLNYESSSIDHIELWRTADMIYSYFGNYSSDPQDEYVVANNRVQQFSNQLWDAGFDVRTCMPCGTVSNTQAMEFYEMFMIRSENRQKCIANTLWDQSLNPQ